MILSKDSNNNWIPTASGNGTFIGTLAAFNAIKDTLPVNTVAYITDDGNGDLQPVDAVTNGDMHPVTSNAVYDTLKDGTFNINARTVVSNGLPDDLHEGGEFELARPDGSTYKSLGKLYIDSYDNKMRFFGTNSSNTTTMFEIDFTDNKVRFNGTDMMNTPVDISSSVTVGSGVTLNSGTLHVVKSGHVVNVSMVVGSITDTTSSYIMLLSGLPAPVLAQEITSSSNSGQFWGLYLNASGGLQAFERASAFTRISFTYICV